MYRKIKSVIVAACAVSALFGVAACGSDDNGADAGSPSVNKKVATGFNFEAAGIPMHVLHVKAAKGADVYNSIGLGRITTEGSCSDAAGVLSEKVCPPHNSENAKATIVCGDSTLAALLIPKVENLKDGKDSVLTTTDWGLAVFPVVYMKLPDLGVTQADLAEAKVPSCGDDYTVKPGRV